VCAGALCSGFLNFFIMKIAYIFDPKTPESVKFYRTAGVMHQISEKITFKPISIHDALQSEAWAWEHDAIWIERYFTQESIVCIQIAKTYGLKVIIDDDDNRIEIPSYLGVETIRYYNSSSTQQNISTAMTAADLVFVSTEYLASLYAYNFNAKTVLVRNAYNDRLHHNLVPDLREKPIIAWRGSQKHSGDLESVREVMLKHQKALTFHFLGTAPPVWFPLTLENTAPFLPLAQYFSLLKTAAPDFLFVPLLNNNFNKAKSDVSFIEGNVLGSAVIIAPVGLEEFNHPGVIRYKDNADLSTIFASIAKGRIKRDTHVRAGRDYVMEHRTLKAANQKRLKAIQDIF